MEQIKYSPEHEPDINALLLIMPIIDELCPELQLRVIEYLKLKYS